MSFISYIDYDNIPEELGKVLDKWWSKRSRPANIIGISGYHPQAMDGHMALYRALQYGRSPLSRTQREMIAVVTSGLNGCHY